MDSSKATELLSQSTNIPADEKVKSYNKVAALENLLMRQENPMSPYNKFKRSKISAELNESEKLMAIQNNLQSLECAGFPKTPIDSCSCCPTVTPNEDEAALTTVIGLDGCCKETWKRKEFYYTVKARVENAVKVKLLFLY